MMRSFFTTGLSGSTQGSAGKKRSTKKGKKDKNEKEQKDDEWVVMMDAFGRTFWKHKKTGQWIHDSQAPPFGICYPTAAHPAVPMVGAFAPSPVPLMYQPVPPWTAAAAAVIPASPATYFHEFPPHENVNEKDEKKEEYWETRYDKNDTRYWKHTGTKKETYKDPYC